MHDDYFIISSGPAGGLWLDDAGATGLDAGAGARSIIDIMDDAADADFPPRVLAVLAPRPDPREAEAVVPLRSLPCFSCCSAFLVVRGRRDVPPREPGPRTGRPVSWEMGTAAAIGTCCEANERPRAAPPRPRPRPRLTVPSAL